MKSEPNTDIYSAMFLVEEIIFAGVRCSKANSLKLLQNYCSGMQQTPNFFEGLSKDILCLVNFPTIGNDSLCLMTSLIMIYFQTTPDFS